MLVLLFGVSCVGKTSLIQDLKDSFGWLSISTYMTREVRLGETEKQSVTNDYFVQMEAEKKFICVNEIFGNKYGTPKNEIEIAVEDQGRYWMLDFPISKRHLLKEYKYIPVVILAFDKKQLIEQITKSNRLDRLEYILKEYDDYYAEYHNFIDQKNTDIAIVNRPNKLKETSQQIYSQIINNNECSERSRY
jgi:guanylate kinase